VALGVAQRLDLFILTCLRIVFFLTRHSRQNPSGRVINPSQRPLPDNIQHSQQTNRHTSMPRVGFDPTISAVKRPKTYALDRAATGISLFDSENISFDASLVIYINCNNIPPIMIGYMNIKIFCRCIFFPSWSG
jgi:hypothetical protein